MPTVLKIEWIDQENHRSEAKKVKIECETLRLSTIGQVTPE